jgi:hypothetical protein
MNRKLICSLAVLVGGWLAGSGPSYAQQHDREARIAKALPNELSAKLVLPVAPSAGAERENSASLPTSESSAMPAGSVGCGDKPVCYQHNRFHPTEWSQWPGEEEPWQVGYQERPHPTHHQHSDSASHMHLACDACDASSWYFEGGLIALERSRWEGSELVFNAGNPVIDHNDLNSNLELGGMFTVGKRGCDSSEFEITGFWVSGMDSSKTARGAFALTMPVFNPPFSFDDFGTNVSLIDLDYDTDVGGFEVVCRRWCLADSCCEVDGAACCDEHADHSWGMPVSVGLECGLRYLFIDEDFSIYSQFGPAPAPTGFQDFIYRTSAENHLLGPQIGVRLVTSRWHGFDLMFTAREMLALNIIETNASLRELTGNVAFNRGRDEVEFAQLTEVGGFIRWHYGSFEVRGGYQLLWINGYAGAVDQFNRNLGQPGQFDDENGVLLHGPALMFGIHF